MLEKMIDYIPLATGEEVATVTPYPKEEAFVVITTWGHVFALSCNRSGEWDLVRIRFKDRVQETTMTEEERSHG